MRGYNICFCKEIRKKLSLNYSDLELCLLCFVYSLIHKLFENTCILLFGVLLGEVFLHFVYFYGVVRSSDGAG